MKKPVLIIGAGMAGLSAARALKKRGIAYRIFEASGGIGGRATTVRLASGLAVDCGAHWLHGEANPLRAHLSTYGLSHREDELQRFTLFHHGRAQRLDREKDWLDAAIDRRKAGLLLRGKLPDMPVPDLAKNDVAREVLADFARLWNGLDAGVLPSAREFLTDESTPGGPQLEAGIQALLDAFAHDAGYRHITFNIPIHRISQTAQSISAIAQSGESWEGSHVIFTGSLGVLQSGRVAFEPELGSEIRTVLSSIVMGDMNKLIVELAPEFLVKRNIPADWSLQLLDHAPPHFCHVRSGGKPVITLFFSGEAARAAEAMDSAEAVRYLARVLEPVEKLRGFEAHIVGDPLITRWSGNPYTRGAYSACLPGAHRSGPLRHGRLILAGDTFDTRFPASLAGAYRSGSRAAGWWPLSGFPRSAPEPPVPPASARNLPPRGRRSA